MVSKMAIKFCKKCNAETERNASGRCKPCRNASRAAWCAANPDKAKASCAAYYNANLEKIKARHADWIAANREKVKASHAAWCAANLEKGRAYSAAYYAANPEKVKANNAAWNAANPEAARAHRATHRARKRDAEGSHTRADIKALFALQKSKCACCWASIKGGYHVDHIMPLALGGSNDRGNLQLLCPTCNLCKGAKHPADYMQQRGHLL